jgi:hypothetical protein
MAQLEYRIPVGERDSPVVIWSGIGNPVRVAETRRDSRLGKIGNSKR